MPELRTRRQQPNPVTPQVPIPGEFPAIPQEVLDRFPSAKDWQTRLNEFWGRTAQALQEAQRQTAAQVNSTVIWTVDRFLIYTNEGQAQPMFALDATGVRLGNVLVINTPGRKVYIGRGNYQDAQTPFYIDTLGRFSLGANLSWDPDTSTLNITGIINATSGTIGGFGIGSDYIRDTANSFGLASTITGGNDVRVWAGDTFANRGSAPLRMYEDGRVVATNLSGSVITILGDGLGTVYNYGINVGPLALARFDSIRIDNPLTPEANGDVLSGIKSAPTVVKGAYTGLVARGVYIGLGTASGAGTIANAYGLYIDTINIGTANYGLYVATTAANYFAGVSTFNLGLNATSIGATTPGTGAFTTLTASTSIGINGGTGGILNLKQTNNSTTGGFRSIRSDTADYTTFYMGGDDNFYFDNRSAAGGHEFYSNGARLGGIQPTQSDIVGGFKISGLAGVGTRTVVADANGVLSAP